MPARGERVAGAVCTDPGAAPVLQAAGVAVVMMGLDSAALGRLASALRDSDSMSGAGRVAVFVGDPDDPADLSSAVEMAEEQFGAAPVVVRSLVEARSLVAGLPPKA